MASNKLEVSDFDFDSIKANLKTFLQSQSEFSDYNFYHPSIFDDSSNKSKSNYCILFLYLSFTYISNLSLSLSVDKITSSYLHPRDFTISFI